MFGWFKKKETPVEEEEAAFALSLPKVGERTSFLGPSLLISGKISGKDDVQLLGRHEGSIDLNGDLAIQESAVVSGLVAAGSISVSGSVEGDLRARRRLHIRQSARVSGTVATPSALVEEGALLEGKVEMNGTD
jgi:cytoskeletal protein CcmA (bactofilin family)